MPQEAHLSQGENKLARKGTAVVSCHGIWETPLSQSRFYVAELLLVLTYLVKGIRCSWYWLGNIDFRVLVMI